LTSKFVTAVAGEVWSGVAGLAVMAVLVLDSLLARPSGNGEMTKLRISVDDRNGITSKRSLETNTTRSSS